MTPKINPDDLTLHRIPLLIASILLAAPWWVAPVCGEPITIVTAEDARPPVRFAAAELVSYLGRIYPADRFAGSSRPEPGGKAAVLVLDGSEAARAHGLSAAGPGGYRIKHVRAAGGGELLVVVAERPEAMPHAVYGLLGALGCAFGFGEEAVPGPRPEGSLDFAACELADLPLSRDRYIFTWHKPRLEVLNRPVRLADDPDALQLIETVITLPYAAKLELPLTPESGPVVISGVRIAPLGKERP